MEVEVDITRDDYLAFNNYVMSKMPLKKFRFIIVALAILVVCILTVRNMKDFLNLIVFTTILVIIVTIIAFLFKAINNRFVKRLPLEKGGILGKHIFKIENEGIREITEYNDSLLKWEGIKSIETTNKHIFIFVDKHMAHIIPKSSFESDEECNNFLNILKNKTVLTRSY